MIDIALRSRLLMRYDHPARSNNPGIVIYNDDLFDCQYDRQRSAIIVRAHVPVKGAVYQRVRSFLGPLWSLNGATPA